MELTRIKLTIKIMSTLLAIESHFLTTANAIEGLKLRELRRLTTADMNATKKRFETSLQLSQIVAEGFEWYKSTAGKSTMANEGITWNAEEFALKVYGYQKSFFYKLVKAGAVEENKVEEYKEFEPNNRTIEGLLKFIKSGGAEGAESKGGEDGEETAERPATVLTFTYKTDSGNVSVRVDSNGVVKTTNTNEQITEAIAFLLASINNQSNN
jgi:hypothetical protein